MNRDKRRGMQSSFMLTADIFFFEVGDRLVLRRLQMTTTLCYIKNVSTKTIKKPAC